MTCASCQTDLFYYQKDGLGILKRLYLDRIYDLESGKPKKDLPDKLKCESCGQDIGTFFIYEKENRPAYKLRRGILKKKIVKKN